MADEKYNRISLTDREREEFIRFCNESYTDNGQTVLRTIRFGYRGGGMGHKVNKSKAVLREMFIKYVNEGVIAKPINYGEIMEQADLDCEIHGVGAQRFTPTKDDLLEMVNFLRQEYIRSVPQTTSLYLDQLNEMARELSKEYGFLVTEPREVMSQLNHYCIRLQNALAECHESLGNQQIQSFLQQITDLSTKVHDQEARLASKEERIIELFTTMRPVEELMEKQRIIDELQAATVSVDPNVQEELSTTKRSLKKCTDRLSATEKQLQETTEQLSTAHRKTKETTQELSVARNAVEELQKTTDQLSIDHREAKETIEQLLNDRHQAQELSSAQSKELHQAKEQLSSVQKTLVERSEELSSVKKQLEQREDELVAMQRIASEQKRKHESITTTSDVEQQLRRVSMQNEQMLRELKKLSGDYWSLSKQAATMKTKHHHRKKTIIRVNNEYNEAVQTLGEAVEKYKRAKSELKAKTEEVNQLKVKSAQADEMMQFFNKWKSQ